MLAWEVALVRVVCVYTAFLLAAALLRGAAGEDAGGCGRGGGLDVGA